jgi:hypothetical protein
MDGEEFRRNLADFRSGYVALFLDAGTIYNNSIMDFVLLRTVPGDENYRYQLYRSVDSVDADADFDRAITSSVLEDLKQKNIDICAIVGDGLPTQFADLSEESEASIQNSHEHTSPHRDMRNIFFVYCSCHLLNLAFEDVLAASRFLDRCTRYVVNLGKALRTKRARLALRANCPTFSRTRWCHVHVLTAFCARHYTGIQSLYITMPMELFGYAVLVEPISVLMGQFESRGMLFYKRTAALRSFYVRINRLQTKFSQGDYMSRLCELIKSAVEARFSRHNRDIEFVANYLGERTEPDERHLVVIRRSGHLKDFFEALLNERVLNDILDRESDVMEHREEEDEAEEDEDEESLAHRQTE